MDHGEGRTAARPWQFGWPAWRQVLKRVWNESGTDNLGLVAAGVAFFGFLAIVPALASLLLTYGLFASPDLLIKTITTVSQRLPENAAELINTQIIQLAQASGSGKSWGLVGSFALAIYGMTKGVDGLVTAITVAYDDEETRGFVRRTLVVLGLTLFVIVFAIVVLTAVSLVSLPAHLLPFDAASSRWLVALIGSVLLMLFGAAVAAVFFRFAPCRSPARWSWLSPGALFTALGWLVTTSGFAFYARNFGDYGATWGSLAGIVVLLTWLYLSAYALLLGAELNAELEHQTACDTTTGPEKPIGQRGAYVADSVA